MQEGKMLLQSDGPELSEQQRGSAGGCQDCRSDYIFGPKLFMMSCHIVLPFKLLSGSSLTIAAHAFRSFSVDGGNLPVNDGFAGQLNEGFSRLN
jgi:hypothetical protein